VRDTKALELQCNSNIKKGKNVVVLVGFLLNVMEQDAHVAT
jgi:hypothetical protein